MYFTDTFWTILLVIVGRIPMTLRDSDIKKLAKAVGQCQFFFIKCKNCIDQSETKLETSKSEYTGMNIEVNEGNKHP
jgi:hypothetical protein